MTAGPGRQMRWAVVAVVALALALGLALGFVLYQASQPEKWDPLGQYPIQTVTNRVPGIQGPAVMLGQDLAVSSTKCNDTTQRVAVRGRYEWVLTIPPGTVVPSGSASAFRLPGCTAFSYLNPMPAEVVKRSQAVYFATKKYPVWRITGQETPYNENGKGVPRTYQSENFQIVVP